MNALLLALCAGMVAGHVAWLGAAALLGLALLQVLSLVLRSGWRASWRWLRRWRLWRWRLVMCLLAYALAGLWAQWAAQSRPEALPERLEKQDFVIVGEVLSLPEARERGIRFIFRPEQATTLDGQRIELADIELRWYAPDTKINIGDRLRLEARLTNYRNYGNPGGFDYAGYRRAQGLQARGYVRCCLVRLGNEASLVAALRAYVSERISSNPSLEHDGLIRALLLGDRSGIDRDINRIMRNLGVSHLLAISGLHIGLIALMFWWLARLGLRLALRWGGLVSSYIPALLISTLAAGGYALLSGWQLPAQRAFFMLTAIVLLQLVRQGAAGLSSLLLALVLVLAIDPWAWQSPGFWMSFMAVTILMLQAGGWQQAQNWRQRLWRKWLRPQFLITIGLAPFILLFWNKLSPWSIPLNLLLIPIVGLVLMPLLLAALLSIAWAPLSDVLLLASDWLLRGMALLLLEFDNWRPLYLLTAPPNTLSVVLLLGAALAILLPIGWRRKWPALLALLLLLTPQQQQRPPLGSAWVTMLDSGQGLAVAIRTAKHDLLYDTGTSSRVVLDYFYHQGQDQLSELVLSHSDFDHSGGAPEILQQLPVAVLRANFALPQPAWQNNQLLACARGQSFNYDGVQFTVLHPDIGRLDGNDNRDSCVVLIEAGGSRVLLAGDIDEYIELRLVRELESELRAQVLVAPHHGSKSSSSMEFIEAVQPEHVLFSAGYKNHFGHPHPEVQQRYQRYGSRTYQSSVHGALRVQLGEGDVVISSANEQ